MKNTILIIAEAGVNHNGSLERALELIDVAADAGADIVKFQTFKSEAVISRFAVKADYQIKSTGASETQLEMVKKLELDDKAHHVLADHCKKRSIQFMSTPFDLGSVDLLVKDLKVERLKISSGEISNAPLLVKAAQSGKPIILSTGMSTLGDVETALGILAFGYTRGSDKPSIAAFEEAYYSINGQEALKRNIALLHCTTEYPSPFNDVNLHAMKTMAQAFGLPVGLSDHTEGIVIPIAAVAMGGTIIEKHFTLDKNLPGPDHKASLDPLELRAMVKAIREVEQALGVAIKMPAPSEIKNKAIARKSLVASRQIQKGEIFSLENLTTKRPGAGLPPIRLWDMVGKHAHRDFLPDEVITENAN